MGEQRGCAPGEEDGRSSELSSLCAQPTRHHKTAEAGPAEVIRVPPWLRPSHPITSPSVARSPWHRFARATNDADAAISRRTDLHLWHDLPVPQMMLPYPAALQRIYPAGIYLAGIYPAGIWHIPVISLRVPPLSSSFSGAVRVQCTLTAAVSRMLQVVRVVHTHRVCSAHAPRVHYPYYLQHPHTDRVCRRHVLSRDIAKACAWCGACGS